MPEDGENPPLPSRRHRLGSAVAGVALAATVGAFVVTEATSEPATAALPGATAALAVDVATELDVSTSPSIPDTEVLGDVTFRAPATVPRPGGALDLPTIGEVPQTGGLTEVIRRYFGDVTIEAIVIVQCESAFDPNAVGTNDNGTQDHGLFQINDVHMNAFEAVTGRPWDDRYDPEVNTAFAAWLYVHSEGWGPWRCNRNLVGFDESPDDAPDGGGDEVAPDDTVDGGAG